MVNNILYLANIVFVILKLKCKFAGRGQETIFVTQQKIY